MRLSLVTSLYNSSSHLAEFYQRSKDVCMQIAPESHEIILVNDGSPDSSLAIALALRKKDKCVKVIDLSRNHGHHKALMIGLRAAEADLIYVLDCDLEESPEWCGLFKNELEKYKVDLVFGFQGKRRGQGIERLAGRLFYSVFNLLAGVRIHPNQTVARLMTDEYRRALIAYGERDVFFAGLCELAGFRQLPFQVVKGSGSQTTYNLSRKVGMFVASITSFSSKPLIIIFYAGLLVSIISLASCIVLVLIWLLKISPVSGWISLMSSLWLIGGLLMLFLGVIGIYLAKIFDEVKRRPYATIRHESSED